MHKKRLSGLETVVVGLLAIVAGLCLLGLCASIYVGATSSPTIGGQITTVMTMATAAVSGVVGTVVAILIYLMVRK